MVSILSEEPSGVSHSGKTSVDRLLSNFSMGYFPAQIFHHFSLSLFVKWGQEALRNTGESDAGGSHKNKPSPLWKDKTRQSIKTVWIVRRAELLPKVCLTLSSRPAGCFILRCWEVCECAESGVCNSWGLETLWLGATKVELHKQCWW